MDCEAKRVKIVRFQEYAWNQTIAPPHFLNRGGYYSWSFQHGYNIVAAHFQFHMHTASKASWLQSAENTCLSVGVFCAFLGGTEQCYLCAGEVENIHQVKWGFVKYLIYQTHFARSALNCRPCAWIIEIVGQYPLNNYNKHVHEKIVSPNQDIVENWTWLVQCGIKSLWTDLLQSLNSCQSRILHQLRHQLLQLHARWWAPDVLI